MQISCVVLICFTSLLLRETASQLPYFIMHNDDHSPFYLAAGVLAAFLAFSVSKRKTKATSTTSTTSTTTIPLPQCRNGYTLYPGPGKSFCFRYGANCRTFADAKTACMADSAVLSILDDSSLLPFLAIMNAQMPTTFSCTTPNVVWLNAITNNSLEAVYPDGRTIPLDIEQWAPDEPSTPNDCMTVQFSVGSSSLFDNSCERPEKYVCQQS